jgi:flagellar hook-associated protein FlgK
MNTQIQSLSNQLQKLEKRIAEVEARLPAHSAKPTIMHELFDLEDERDQLLAEISELRSNSEST